MEEERKPNYWPLFWAVVLFLIPLCLLVGGAGGYLLYWKLENDYCATHWLRCVLR